MRRLSDSPRQHARSPTHRTAERSGRAVTIRILSDRHGVRDVGGVASPPLVQSAIAYEREEAPREPARERDDGDILAAGRRYDPSTRAAPPSGDRGASQPLHPIYASSFLEALHG